MANNNKKCLLCGTEFKFCPTCQQKSSADAWKNIFDSENCRKIFHVACDFAQKAIDANEAKKILSECDLSNKDSFKSDIKAFVNEIINIGSNVVEEEKEDDKKFDIKQEDFVKKDVNKKARNRNYKK